jgi:anhydro-N-acetylmuramic acid kinase
MVKSQLSDTPRLIVGLMSGTSADGIDAVVARISGTGQSIKAELVAHHQQPFTAALRKHILHVCLHGKVAEICELNFLLGEHFAAAALKVIRKAGLHSNQIDAIGSHGQTIHHLPRAKTPSTLQIGEPCVIAEQTGILTIGDFRVRDVAAGGQGAPLVTYVDWAMQTHPTKPRILQNIGGIGNLTFLPAAAKMEDVMAFDTGPGNMVMDAVVEKISNGRLKYDQDGKWAAKGNVSYALLNELLQHPFLRRKPPKTTGREEFGELFISKLFASKNALSISPEDLLATVTAFTASSIADAYRRFIPQLKPAEIPKLEVILGGGGAKNGTLRRMIAAQVSPAIVTTQEELGFSNAGKEALAFAVLAHETLNGFPSNIPRATGAKRPVILGKIAPY